MKNDTSESEGDTSNLVAELFAAAESSGSLFMEDLKSSVSLQLRSMGKSAAITIVSCLAMFIGGVYLLYFGIDVVLLLVGVSPGFTGPTFALLLVLAGLSLRFLNAPAEEGREEGRRRDLENIENFKRRSTEFLEKLKSIIENPLGFTRDKTFSFIESFDFRDFKKYKSVVITLIVAGSIAAIRSISGRVTNIKSMGTFNNADYRGYHTDNFPGQGFASRLEPPSGHPVWDPVKKTFMALISALSAALIKDLISEIVVEVRSRLAASSPMNSSNDSKRKGDGIASKTSSVDRSRMQDMAEEQRRQLH